MCVCLCVSTGYSLLSWSVIRMRGLFSHLSTWNQSLATGRSSRNRWTSPPYVRSLWAASKFPSRLFILFLLKAFRAFAQSLKSEWCSQKRSLSYTSVWDVSAICDFFTFSLFCFNFRYQNLETFIIDVNLVFDNCEKFNEDNSDIGRAGHNMRKFFEKRWTELLKQTN